MSVKVWNTVSAPESLDANFFQEMLEDLFFGADIKLTTISFEMGSASGDNYCSQIYRARLGFQGGGGPEQGISVIVKSVPVMENLQFLEDLAAFVKEEVFYTKFLPRIEFLLKNVKLAPKLYRFLREPIRSFVFEDLADLGYVMGDRESGLDFDHAELVMRKLGSMHAVSMILHKKDADCMKAFSSGLLSAKAVNGSETLATLFGNNLQGIIDLVGTWHGFERIVEKLRKYRANFKRNLINSQLPMDGEVRVLNHGDLWVNNCLFKYSKSVVDVVFVDFQMSVFGSPGYDLNYFLNTSVRLDVLRERRKDLLRVYHSGMTQVLKTHRFGEVPSFRDILIEVRRREPFGFFAVFGVLPGALLSRANSGDSNIDNFMDADFARKKLASVLSGRRMQETLRYTLKRFDALGIWD